LQIVRALLIRLRLETNRNERVGSKSSRETRGRRGCIPGVENDSKGKRERRREREREREREIEFMILPQSEVYRSNRAGGSAEDLFPLSDLFASCLHGVLR